MKHPKSIRDQRSSACFAGLLLMTAVTANADSWTDSAGLMEASGYNPNELGFLKNHNIKIGGWLETSISGNTNAYHDGFNGPVTFQDRSSELQLNQLNFFIQKAVTASADEFDIGGRFDIMFGSDSIFTQAYGNPNSNPHTGLAEPRGSWDLKLSGDRFYGFAMPNAYAEVNLPVGDGLDVKIGHFYTPVGYEVVTSPDNFFVTKPYTFQYGEPFTHTGVLGSYTFTPNWSAFAGATTGSSTGGWDGNFNRNLATWSSLFGGTWTSDDTGTSLNLSATAGPQSDNNSSFWGIYSIVGKHNITDKLHLILQHDHGFANNVLTGNGAGATQNAQWYGINSYLLYDVNDKLGAGIRAEWFKDANGWRIDGPGRCGASQNTYGGNYGNPVVTTAPATGQYSSCSPSNFAMYPFQGAGYYELTAGLTYKPVKWLNLRPNVRFDASTDKAFAAGNQHTQVLITADAVVTF